MSDQLERTNRESLATISAYATIPYLWIALLVGLYLLVSGRVLVGVPGIAIAAIICLGIFTGMVPFFLVKNAIQPFFLNLLGRDLVPTSGCMGGLAGFFLACFSILFFVGRDLQLASILFLSAPLIGVLVALFVTLLVRGGLFSTRRPSGPGQVRVEKPKRPALPPPKQQTEISQPPKPGGQLADPLNKSGRPARPGRVPPPKRRD